MTGRKRYGCFILSVYFVLFVIVVGSCNKMYCYGVQKKTAPEVNTDVVRKMRKAVNGLRDNAWLFGMFR